ncbi:phage tail length tape measure family protein [Agrobacterium tumefaciens]|uniref:phage tail length tape measure family protein n=1 Tax=Agrobacterium tumefaciens TaxID=358 RepID=UPI003BA03957
MSNATLGFQIDSSQASSAAADLDRLTAAATRTQQAADKLEAEAKLLGSAFGSAGTGAGKALPAVDGLGKKLQEQDEHVRSFRMELERLTLKYQPLARATQSYEASVSEINRAHQLGVINAQQMQKALDAERMSFERLKTSATAAGAAVKAANSNASGGQSFNAANAGYQFQDIAVTAAMGMNPLMIGLQQGTQLASVVSAMERPVAGLATAFASLISPVSLITIGLTAGTAALIQYFSTGSEGSDGMSDDLRAQAELIAKVAERWGDATPKLKAYADELNRVAEGNERLAAGEAAASAQYEPIVDILGSINKEFTAARRSLQGYGDDAAPILRNLTTSFQTLQSKILEGTASTDDLKAAQDALNTALEQGGSPALQKLADAFAGLVPQIEKATNAASEFRKEGLGTILPELGKLSPLFSDGGRFLSPEGMTPLNAPIPTRRPLRELEGDDSDNGPATIINSDGLLVNVPIPGRKPNFFELEEQKEKVDDLEKAYRRAQEAKADFWLDLGFSERQSERSSIDQRIASTLNRYGFDENLKSPEANALRDQYQRAEQKALFKGFFADMYSEAWANGGKIGKAIGQAALNAAQEAMGKAWEQIFDKLATGLSNLIFGGSGSSVASSGGGVVAAALSGGAANSNIAKLTEVTRSPLANIPNTDVASYIAKAATARGIDPDVALRVAKSEGGLKSWNLQSTYMKNGVQEPSFGPYQLYMGGGLGNAFQKKTGLDPRLAANGPAGVDFALDHAKKNGWGSWYGADKVGISKWQGIGAGGADTATDAVNKLADAAGSATKGLDTLGGGLGQLGQSLSTSFFPAAPSAGKGGGGGLFSWLGGLFGGGGAQWNAAKSGKITGLFAGGTSYAPGGLAVVGEQGPELVDLPQGSQVFNNNKSRAMVSGANDDSAARYQPRPLNVYVQGANTDAQIRELSLQGAREAIQQDKIDQARGGFGSINQQYSARKG